MKAVLISILTFVIILSLCAFVAWCGGYNFDHRGIDVGYIVGSSLFISALFTTGVFVSID